MATSSVTHNFVITKPESIQRFIEAIEASERERDRIPKRTLPGRLLTDPEEIRALTEEWIKNNEK